MVRQMVFQQTQPEVVVPKMTLPGIVSANGVRLEMSNQDGNDYIRSVWSVKATHPDGPSVTWNLPNRLLERLDICQAVCEEIVAELHEHVAMLETAKARGWVVVKETP